MGEGQGNEAWDPCQAGDLPRWGGGVFGAEDVSQQVIWLGQGPVQEERRSCGLLYHHSPLPTSPGEARTQVICLVSPVYIWTSVPRN